MRFTCSFLTRLFIPGLLSAFSITTFASIGASFDQVTLALSDGGSVSAVPAGSSQNQWMITEDGTPIVIRDGYWFYAEIRDGRAYSLGIPLVNSVAQREPEQEMHVHADAHAVTYSTGDNHAYASHHLFSAEGDYYDQPLLLIRVSFTNQSFGYDRSGFEQLIFSTASDNNSVAGYFLENSYQRFRIVPVSEQEGEGGDGIVDVRLNRVHPDFGSSYGSASVALANDAISAADDYVNFRQYDRNGDGVLSPDELGIVIMVAGYENAYGGAGAAHPRVWAHKADLSRTRADGVQLASYAMFGERHGGHLATIGIICHELGHLLFGLPDLYDRQGDSHGVGRWGLMGLGSWNSQGGYAGNSPAHMLAWSKDRAGFMSPREVSGQAGQIEINSATRSGDALRVWLDPFRHGEHFLLEYREDEGFDEGLPGSGLLITHVDDWIGLGDFSVQNDVAEHKLVDIEEADGRGDLDSMRNRGDRYDLFSQESGVSYFGSASVPASLDYQGNSSGMELDNITVSGEKVLAGISLPYDVLGNNIGHDRGVISGPWGAPDGNTEIMAALDVPADNSWVHGIDVYSHGRGSVVVRLYRDFHDGALSTAIYHSVSFDLATGWNRLSFSERINLAEYDRVYLQLSADILSGRPFSADSSGVASGQSYTKDAQGRFRSASFDFNLRMLVATQEEAFAYQVPRRVMTASADSRSSSSGGAVMFFGFLCLFLPAMRRRVFN